MMGVRAFCRMIGALALSAAFFWQPSGLRAQSCVPTYSAGSSGTDDPCSGAGSGTYCGDSITQTLLYSALFPDGYRSSQTAMASGYSSSTQSCVNGGLGPPYGHTNCFPTFYTPQVSDTSFVATEMDTTTTVSSYACCSDTCLFGMGIKAPTNFVCTDVPPAHSVQITHTCATCK